MVVTPIKTNVFKKADTLEEFLSLELDAYNLESKVLAISTKLISIAENCFVSIKDIEKSELIKKEADVYLGECDYGVHLTVKHGLFILSAGIDESNSEQGEYILYPKDPLASANKIHSWLKKKFGLKNFGIILTDSRTSIMRRGVTGVALSYYGFRGVQQKAGEKDLFNKEIKVTSVNIADALATSATLCMGETNESQPLALIDYPVEFIEGEDSELLKVDIKDDIYRPLFE